MKVVAIIQARMGSTRLPGKVLKEIEGQTMLARVIQRVQRAKLVNEVWVATTDSPSDDPVVKEARACKAQVFRGDEKDVLDRYFRAAQLCKADVVVRITSDCPLIDPEVVDKTVQAFLDEKPDYASNCLTRTYPRGLDTEVINVRALERAWRTAHQPHQREHVTPFIIENPKDFSHVSVTAPSDYSNYRWTVDTAEDLEFVREIYARLKGEVGFRGPDIFELLAREPQLMEINRAVMQKALHEG